jgi:putative ABC transport system permease protein
MRYETARDELHALIDQAFAVSHAVIFVCVIVSIIGIVGFLLAAVAYRAREYQLASRIGLDRGHIVRSVVVEALLVATTGVVAGLVAGAATSWIIVSHSVPMVTGWRFDFLFPWATAALLVAGTFAMAGIAGLLPGNMAARASGAARYADE